MIISEPDTRRSQTLHQRALKFLPGGVTGEGRRASPFPISIASAHGNEIIDVDGNRYLDYHGGYGTAILGYTNSEVEEAVVRATRDCGTFVGVPHPYEVDLADRLCSLLGLADRVAFCGGGGSDAVYHAVRLARATTSRTKIVKAEGAYHGWHADVGVASRGIGTANITMNLSRRSTPNSAGSLRSVSEEVRVVPLNDVPTLESVFLERGEEIAALILEPVSFSLGCVRLEADFMQAARRLCSDYGAVLIFDEVMSGFRTGIHGSGDLFGLEADLAAFGKAIANGHIIAVLAGREDLMCRLAPEGDVFYSGTFNGHPLSVAAAHATLDVLERDAVPERIAALGSRLATGVNAAIEESQISAVCQSFGSVWTLYFNCREVRSFDDLYECADDATIRRNEDFLKYLRGARIFLTPRFANRGFVSASHDEQDIDRTIDVISSFLATLDK